jgi:hypothetical protein
VIARTIMHVLATGTYTNPGKLDGPLAEEIHKIQELRKEGVVLSGYRRADGIGVFLVLQVASLEEARKRTDEFPFVKAGLLHIDFTEVTPL